jgi:general secretion pathway protein B
MSFILDALKKSELERQRQTTPGLIEVGAANLRPRFPPWALGLGALLGINLIVLSVVLLRHGNTVPPPTAAQTTAAPVGGATGATGAASATGAGHSAAAVAATQLPADGPRSAPATDHFSPMDGTPTYAPEIPVAESVAVADDATAAKPTAKRPTTVAKTPATTSEDDTEEVLPTLSELSSSATAGLPELHLDVHVYATIPADRFVFINGHKYREGMKLEEGPLLERIRRDGIVLNYQGVRFLLPRE